MRKHTTRWHKIADHIDAINWGANQLALVEVGTKKITLIKRGTEVLACAHKCPHASGILADGFIDATGNVVCPLHRYKFNPVNGRNVSGEGYYLKVYPVEQRDAGLFIGFDESSFWGL